MRPDSVPLLSGSCSPRGWSRPAGRFARLRRVRDRIDGSAVKAEGIPTWVAKQVSRPVRNREAPAAAQPLA